MLRLLRSLLFLILATLAMSMAFPGQYIRTVVANPSLLRVPQEYPRIQDAINAASPGDTVLVSPGTYNENLVITKSLNLTGMSKTSTIIDGQSIGPGVNITSTSQVTVSGFTIRNPGYFNSTILIKSSISVSIHGNILSASPESNGTYVNDSNNSVIRGNIITGSLRGVAVQGGFANTVQSNNITSPSSGTLGLAVLASIGNKIVNNRLFNGGTVLQVMNGSSGNIVARNLVVNGSSYGLDLEGVTGNRFIENNIQDNRALSSSIGIHIQSSTGNQFYHNNIVNNTIQVYAVFASDVTGNIWDDQASPLRRGNYWSDYTGQDLDGDGVGDTKIPHPWPCAPTPCSPFTGLAGVDSHPLIARWIPSPITVQASGQPLNGCAPLTVNLTAVATGGLLPYSYNWNFGDGSTGSGQNVTHQYSLRKSLFAVLTVVDNSAQNATDSVALTVFSGALIAKVVDESRNPVSGANLTIRSAPPGQPLLSGIADNGGFVTFPCLVPGHYTLGFSAPGFLSTTVGLTMGNSTINQSFVIKRPANPLATYAPVIVGAGLAVTLVALGVLGFRRRRRKQSTTAASTTKT